MIAFITILIILSSSMHSQNSTELSWVWLIGVNDVVIRYALFVVLIARIRCIETTAHHGFVLAFAYL